MEEKRASLPLVIARIFIVSGIAFTAAIGLFLLIVGKGGAWQAGLLSLGATVFFIILMFVLERIAERRGG